MPHELPKDIKDSVIKLESDISKTIENNNNKLIEVQKEIDIMFNGGGNKILGIVDEPRPEVEQEEIIDGQRQKFAASKSLVDAAAAAAAVSNVDTVDDDDGDDADEADDLELKTTILLPTSTESVTESATTIVTTNKIEQNTMPIISSITTTEQINTEATKVRGLNFCIFAWHYYMLMQRS